MNTFFKPYFLPTVILFPLFPVLVSFGGKVQKKAGRLSFADTSLNAEIRKQLADQSVSSGLYFPKSVARLYKDLNFSPAWFTKQNNHEVIWQAMTAIDSVSNYGLALPDYHPLDLRHSLLRDTLTVSGKADIDVQARFDILLTDAILTLVNNLHFGKLNPDYPAVKIDSDTTGNFRAERVLKNVLAGRDILNAIDNVQPHTAAYVNLERQLRKTKALSRNDFSHTAAAEARKIAVNMERLRWAETGDSVYIHVNIPSFTLKLHLRDTVQQFKVIVGKPAAPTPQLLSAVSYFTTAPEWTVPSKIFRKELLPEIIKNPEFLENGHYSIYDLKGRFIEPTADNLRAIKIRPDMYFLRQSAGCDNSLGLLVFRFPNIYEVYLHDTPEQKLFTREKRAFSHGCVRVENAEQLARMLLINDGSAARIRDLHNGIVKYIQKNIRLKRPVPIKITYLTTEVSDGKLLIYPDIYDLDGRLEMALFGSATL